MKNIVLSAVAVFAMSSFAVAGGDIAPIEEPEVVVEEVAAPAWSPKFYIGAGYVNVAGTIEDNLGDTDLTADNYALAAGMIINQYLAIEGRYSNSFSDATVEPANGPEVDLPGGEAEVAAIFAKPMYPVTDQFIVYGLVGYANVSVSDDNVDNYMDDDGLAYGLGAAYAVNANVLVFADWTRLYDDTVEDTASALDGLDVTVDTFNIGVAYVF